MGFGSQNCQAEQSGFVYPPPWIVQLISHIEKVHLSHAFAKHVYRYHLH